MYDLNNNSIVFKELSTSVTDLTVANAVLLTTQSRACEANICHRLKHNTDIPILIHYLKKFLF